MAGTQIANKTVIVTGANRGIGLEFARQLVQKGNTVLAGVRNPSSAHELQKVQGVQIEQLDVSDPASIQAWAQRLASRHQHVDYVINNAGVYGPKALEVDTVTAEDMIETYKVNTIGPLLVVQQLLKQGLIGPPGTVVGNVTSKVGSVSDNGSGGSYAYRASKSALNNVNKSLSIDLKADQITCVLLHPGWVKTDMTNNNGLIDAATSAKGLLSVLESDLPLNGHWYDYKQEEIPW
jgi:NAD(P)-dependent dehydrogenase (short-subunit alcohol dehydrogenase family)